MRAYNQHMSGRSPRAMRQGDKRAYPVVQDAMDKGHLDSGEAYIINGLPDHETANQSRLSVGRALVAHNFARAAWVIDADGQPCNPLKEPCKAENAPHGVGFRLIAKNKARAYIAEQTGGDPSKLKYNPFASKKAAAVDDDGRPAIA